MVQPLRVHELLRPQPLTQSDLRLLKNIIESEDFLVSARNKLGPEFRVEVLLDKNFIKLISPKQTKVIWIDVLLAHEKGQIH